MRMVPPAIVNDKYHYSSSQTQSGAPKPTEVAGTEESKVRHLGEGSGSELSVHADEKSWAWRKPDEKRATAKVPLKCQGQRLLSTKAFASRE